MAKVLEMPQRRSCGWQGAFSANKLPSVFAILQHSSPQNVGYFQTVWMAFGT